MARVEYLSVYYLSVLWWNISLCPFPVFLLDCLFFCCCVSKVSLFIFQIPVLYQDIWFANIFSQSVDCLFNLHGIFCRAKFKLIKSEFGNKEFMIWATVSSRSSFCWLYRASLYSCFWTVVLEKTLESTLDCKDIKPVNPSRNWPWTFIGRTDAKAEAPIFWPSDAKNWLIRKDPDAGKEWRQEGKGKTEDEIVEWHHQLNEHEFE